jgi:hypothetical protein
VGEVAVLVSNNYQIGKSLFMEVWYAKTFRRFCSSPEFDSCAVDLGGLNEVYLGATIANIFSSRWRT